MNQSDEYVSKWKEDIPCQPLNVIDTRTFAERVEEALTIEAFRAWLESKDGDEVVGRACNSEKCPIHDFLEPCLIRKAEERNTRLEVVSSGAVVRFGSGWAESALLPEWAGDFIVEVDRNPGFATYPPVTAEQALAILAEVEKGLADTGEKGEGQK